MPHTNFVHNGAGIAVLRPQLIIDRMALSGTAETSTKRILMCHGPFTYHSSPTLQGSMTVLWQQLVYAGRMAYSAIVTQLEAHAFKHTL